MLSFIDRAHSVISHYGTGPGCEDNWSEVLRGYKTTIQEIGRRILHEFPYDKDGNTIRLPGCLRSQYPFWDIIVRELHEAGFGIRYRSSEATPTFSATVHITLVTRPDVTRWFAGVNSPAGRCKGLLLSYYSPFLRLTQESRLSLFYRQVYRALLFSFVST
jgi:hypothetical protein